MQVGVRCWILLATVAGSTSTGNNPCLKALENFERSLEIPMMSGELIGWVATVQRACEDVGALLHNDVQRKHAALYATIARQDTELASRVKKLRANDKQLKLDVPMEPNSPVS